MTDRRSFLSSLFRATATVAFLGVARLSVAAGLGFEREPLWPGLHALWNDDEFWLNDANLEDVWIAPSKRVDDVGLAHKLRPMT